MMTTSHHGRSTPPPPPYPPPAMGSDAPLLGFATNALKATQGLAALYTLHHRPLSQMSPAAAMAQEHVKKLEAQLLQIHAAMKAAPSSIPQAATTRTSQKLPVVPFMPAGQYVQGPPHQYNSVRYVHAPHAPTFQAPVQHYRTARTYAAPMALPAPQLQQYVPAPRVQFIAQYVPVPPMPMQVHTVSAPPMPIQRELPRLSRTITLNNPENPYYNEYGVERYNRSETHNNSAANYEYMTNVKWDQPPQTIQNAQTNYSSGYSGEDSTRTVSLNDPENPYYSQYAAMREA